mmetsp:Transcript_106834/g.297419  ORF Transcript_106834/g.297419 Transcript_106834/m.297419 type:complete len:209 (-) Transcript_106834:817-1443(-)
MPALTDALRPCRFQRTLWSSNARCWTPCWALPSLRWPLLRPVLLPRARTRRRLSPSLAATLSSCATGLSSHRRRQAASLPRRSWQQPVRTPRQWGLASRPSWWPCCNPSLPSMARPRSPPRSRRQPQTCSWEHPRQQRWRRSQRPGRHPTCWQASSRARTLLCGPSWRRPCRASSRGIRPSPSCPVSCGTARTSRTCCPPPTSTCRRS